MLSPQANISMAAVAVSLLYRSVVIVHPSRNSTDVSPACLRFSFLSSAITNWCIIGIWYCLYAKYRMMAIAESIIRCVLFIML